MPKYYTDHWQCVNIPDGCYTGAIELYAAMMEAMESQHPRPLFGAPFAFGINHNKHVVSRIWTVAFSPNILHILGLKIDHNNYQRPLRQWLGVAETTAFTAYTEYIAIRLKKPVFTSLDAFHVNASIVSDQQVFGNKLSPLLCLVMQLDVLEKRSDSVYHEFRKLHYKSVSATTLDVITVDVEDIL